MIRKFKWTHQPSLRPAGSTYPSFVAFLNLFFFQFAFSHLIVFLSSVSVPQNLQYQVPCSSSCVYRSLSDNQ
ncbi:hypothetical protein BDY19DRAFT_940953 [Irpex rosettiformis]|uniref:Uncharacterized protein n=1 Tax=Irpex rosettiformis TaxID=378272 RepID=A0ACB8U6D3_9APHY|nr:hypothetical protein BDY19DRAFT_940953 [Irpex rosettiformis]